MDIFDNFRQAVGNFMSKKGKDVVLPNEAPVTESRKQEHAQRLREDVSQRFQKVADRAKKMGPLYKDNEVSPELVKNRDHYAKQQQLEQELLKRKQ